MAIAQNTDNTRKNAMGEERGQTEPGLGVICHIRLGNALVLFFDFRSPQGAIVDWNFILISHRITSYTTALLLQLNG